MPSKSKAQRNLMAAAAHNPAFAKKVGVPMSVAKDFNQADKGKNFKGGGMAKACATKSDAKMIAKKEVKGHESSMHKMKKGGIIEKGTGEKYKSKAAMMKHEKKETKAEEMKEHKMKKGGMCGYASGGKVSQLSKANGIAKQGKSKGRII
jgi:hypothetical protein